MPRFLRKSSAKESKKDKKTEKDKKTKEKKTEKFQPGNLYDEEEESTTQNGFIGVGRCRKLLASCPNRSGSAKCVATFQRKSRLSKSLLEVLMDDSVLPYFMEFMQTQNATNLLNFWLTTETFHLSTISRLKINSLSRMKSTDTLINGNDNCLSGAGCSSSSNDSRTRILSDSSSDSDFGCFTGYLDTTEHTGPKQLLDNLNTGALLICDKCGNIVPKKYEKCTICDLNNTGGHDNVIIDNAFSSSDPVDNVFDGTIDKSETKKVTFDLKPDYENEEREYCRRRTRSIIIDAMSIYSKYISLEATNPFGLDEPLRRQVEANICSEDGKIDPQCFAPAHGFAFRVMDRMYYPTFVHSPLYSKHQLDILTSKVFLSDIIYNEHAMFYFMEFLEQEGVRHMLEFWLTADNFQSMLKDKIDRHEYNSQQALDDAMIIYERYFSMQASLPLGFDDITRIEIENNICRDGGPLPDCLSTPLEHILCLLEEVFFPSFLQSDIYFKYLNELLNSVSDTPHSDEISVASESTKIQSTDENTLLVDAFGSELDLAENPDAIWHRPNAGPLCIGRVNEFGIYEPIFTPEPDRDRHNTSTAAKLGKAMRKLVSGGEDKAKEEMAWKIAKMMIEDVKSQTE